MVSFLFHFSVTSNSCKVSVNNIFHGFLFVLVSLRELIWPLFFYCIYLSLSNWFVLFIYTITTVLTISTPVLFFYSLLTFCSCAPFSEMAISSYQYLLVQSPYQIKCLKMIFDLFILLYPRSHYLPCNIFQVFLWLSHTPSFIYILYIL